MRTATLKFLLVSLVFSSGCKVTANLTPPPARTVPASFGDGSDSASMAQMSWRTYFADTALTHLIDTALAYNQNFKQAIERVEQARASAFLQKAAVLPAVTVGAQAQAERYGDYTMNGVGNFDTNLSGNINEKQRVNRDATPYYFLGFRSAWEVDLWHRLRSRRRAAALRLLASEQGRRLVQSNLVAEVATTYYDLLGFEFELEIVRRNIQLQTRALEITQVQKQAGRGNQLAVEQARAQLLRTRSLEPITRQDIVQAQNRLHVLLGRYPLPVRLGAPILEQKLPARLLVGVPAQMLTRRPDVVQAGFALEATKADADAAKAAFYPALLLTPYAGMESFKLGLLFALPESVTWGVLAGFAAPLINRAPLKAALRQRSADYRIAAYEYQKTAVTAYAETITNLEGIQYFSQATDFKAQEVEAQRRAVEISEGLFKTGFASYLEVITAQRNFLEAELNLVETKKQALAYSINLYRALGGGWE